jgi:hypothetical protein
MSAPATEQKRKMREFSLRLSYGDCVTMRLSEVLATMPTLSFAERQEVVRLAIELDEQLSPEEEAVLADRLRSFRPDSEEGVTADSLKMTIMQRLKPQ